MINAEDALKQILALTPAVGRENVRLINAVGRVLAEDIVADMDLPPFDNSSMDGFAFMSSSLKDIPGALSIIGEASAGNPFKGRVRNGQAVKIMTGGLLPKGADTVIPVERCRLLNDRVVECLERVPRNSNIRRAGEDVAKGTGVLERGADLGPSAVGLLAALGNTTVKVSRRPSVGILATGDELVEIDRRPKKGKIRNSNSYALAALIEQCGAECKLLGIVPDKPEQIRKGILRGLSSDILLVTGGVSVGEHDYVKEVLEDLDVEIMFWRVNIKPGKPLVFGKRRRTLVFGLPGNPVSTSVTFLQFVRPAIEKMTGRRSGNAPQLHALMDESFQKADGKRHFLRGVVWNEKGTLRVKTAGLQSSGAIGSMARANCLIVIPEDSRTIEKGEMVEIELLD